MNFFKYEKDDRGLYSFRFYEKGYNQESVLFVYSKDAVEEAAELCSDLDADFAKAKKNGLPVISGHSYDTFLQLVEELDYQRYLIDIYKDAYGKDFNFEPVESPSSFLDGASEETEQVWCALNGAFNKVLEAKGQEGEDIIDRVNFVETLHDEHYCTYIFDLRSYYLSILKGEKG